MRAPIKEGAALLGVVGPGGPDRPRPARLATPRLDHADVADLAVVDHLRATRGASIRRVTWPTVICTPAASRQRRSSGGTRPCRGPSASRGRRACRPWRRPASPAGGRNAASRGPRRRCRAVRASPRRSRCARRRIWRPGRARAADGHANEPRVLRVVREGVGVHAGHQARTHDPEPDAHDALLVAAGGSPSRLRGLWSAPGRAPRPRVVQLTIDSRVASRDAVALSKPRPTSRRAGRRWARRAAGSIRTGRAPRTSEGGLEPRPAARFRPPEQIGAHVWGLRSRLFPSPRKPNHN